MLASSCLTFESDDDDASVQSNFDQLYEVMRDMLDRFYPERWITVTSSDPHYVTPAIKSMLRRKNRLMRAGRTAEADALACRVRSAITRQSSKWLRDVDTRKNPAAAWEKVREFTHGPRRDHGQPPAGISAQVLNDHYAAISNDDRYRSPPLKLTAVTDDVYITEMEAFRHLDTLKHTATGLDGIPAWFLRVGAPIFAAPLARLFSRSLMAGFVPEQWKAAIITPIPKVTQPSKPSDYRPISVTSVMSRLLEKCVVRRYIYPALSSPPPQLSFDDQFAFRPTGSTTAALVAIMHNVRSMLSANDYVHVIAFDFSKAFDTVRHETMLSKMASLGMPDNIYNWLRDFFSDRQHCTQYSRQRSTVAMIKASVIQGSVVGPSAYVITAGDLHAVTPGNLLLKYADDTYLLVPAANTSTRSLEIEHIKSWAAENNLTLNCQKSQEMIVKARGKRGKSTCLPPPCQDIARVSSMRVLGVTVNDQLTSADHIASTLESANRLLYALRTLRNHGISDASLHDVCRATLIAKVMYAAPAWSGACSAADRAKLEALINRCRRRGYCSPTEPSFSEMSTDADDRLFARSMSNSYHVLQPLLPYRPDVSYDLRRRAHGNKRLICKTTDMNTDDFIIRALYKDAY